MKNSAPRNLSLALAAVAFAALSFGASPVRADNSSYPPDGDNPLRIVHTFVAPVGTLLEWTVTRPIAALGNVIAPYRHIDYKGFRGCSRERPARSCTTVVK